MFISESLTSTSKIEIHQPVQADRPAQQPIQTQQPAQKPSQTYKSNEDELDAAMEAIGSKPSGYADNDPEGPVVVTNTELILPD